MVRSVSLRDRGLCDSPWGSKLAIGAMQPSPEDAGYLDPSPGSGMDAADNSGKVPGPELAAARAAEGGTAASTPVSDHPHGPDAVAILATEHWSLIAARSLLWNEAYSRTTIFLGALSAAIVALALVANATGFGPRTATLALVLLPARVPAVDCAHVCRGVWPALALSARVCSARRRWASSQVSGSCPVGTSQKVKVALRIVGRRLAMMPRCGSVLAKAYTASRFCHADRV